MLNRFATLAAVCMLLPVGDCAPRIGGPAARSRVRGAAVPAGDDGPPPDTGVVASADPGVVTTPDGWVFTRRRFQREPTADRAADHRGRRRGSTWWRARSPEPSPASGKTTPQRRLAGSRLPDRLRHRAGPGPAHRPGRCQDRGLVAAGRPRADRHHLPDLGHRRDPPEAGHRVDRHGRQEDVQGRARRVSRSRTPTSRSTVASDSRSCGRTRRLTSSTTDTDDVVAYYGVTKAV